MAAATTALRVRFEEWESQRACDGCTACCGVHAILETMSPSYRPCRYECPGVGCAIYAARPRECSGYYCAWRMGFGDEEDRPDRSGMVVDVAPPAGAVPVIVIWRPLREAPGQLERAWEMAHDLRDALAAGGAPGATIDVYGVPPTKVVRWTEGG